MTFCPFSLYFVVLTKRMVARSGWILVLSTSLFLTTCKDNSGNEPAADLTPDEGLYLLITLTDPLTSYTLFPNADSVTSGTLNGSSAHQPLVRVSLNATASGILQSDTLPQGLGFPNGSVILKEIILNGETTLYAVIHKDSTDPLAAGGWRWAELRPDGSAFYSITNKGTGCIGCHSLEQGPQNDLVRTFERQN